MCVPFEGKIAAPLLTFEKCFSHIPFCCSINSDIIDEIHSSSWRDELSLLINVRTNFKASFSQIISKTELHDFKYLVI